MLFLLDTNAVSDFMNEHPKVDERLGVLAPHDEVITCTIVRGEILYGLERLAPGRRRDEISAKADAALAYIRCEPVPAAAADHYGRLKASCEQRGTPMDENDLWIAATALTIGAILVSRDGDLFHATSLRIEDWTQ